MDTREAFADGIYCLAYHQLIPSQQFIVDAAVKTSAALKQPTMSEDEAVEIIANDAATTTEVQRFHYDLENFSMHKVAKAVYTALLAAGWGK